MSDEESIGQANGGEPVTERYARQHCTQTAKGWKYETTISIRTTDNEMDMQRNLEILNQEVRYQALAEIAVRSSMDDAMIQKFTQNLMDTMGESVHGK